MKPNEQGGQTLLGDEIPVALAAVNMDAGFIVAIRYLKEVNRGVDQFISRHPEVGASVMDGDVNAIMLARAALEVDELNGVPPPEDMLVLHPADTAFVMNCVKKVADQPGVFVQCGESSLTSLRNEFFGEPPSPKKWWQRKNR